MNELKQAKMLWIVLNPDGTYAGVPCLSWEEAREMVAQKKGRWVLNVDPVIEDVTNSANGLI